MSERLAFQNTGPDQIPGLVVMTLADPTRNPLPGGDLDKGADSLVVLFNATDDPVTYTLPTAKGARIALHPVQAASADPVIRTASFDPALGAFTVPARSTAVYVEVKDDVPPTVSATLVPIQSGGKQGKFTVRVSCTDDVTRDCALKAVLNGVPVKNGDIVQLVVNPGRQTVQSNPSTGVITIKAPAFMMTATCTDEAGNSSTVEVAPQFVAPRPPHD